MAAQRLTKAQREALAFIALLCDHDYYAMRVTLARTRGIRLSSVKVLTERKLVEYFDDCDGRHFNNDYYLITEQGRAALAQESEATDG